MTSLTELRRALRVARKLPGWGAAAFRLACRPHDSTPLTVELRGGCAALRGSRGVRVSDLAILDEVLVEDHYLIADLVQPGQRVLDIGAHVGIFSLLAAWRVGPVGFVLSVEAAPENFALLERNVAANPHLRWNAIQFAASDGPGETRLFRSDWNTGGHRTSVGDGPSCTVAKLGLAELLDRMPGGAADVLKLDCEGCEFTVLGSASVETLRRVGAMVVEMHHFEGEADDGIRMLETKLVAAGFGIRRLSEVVYPGEGAFRTVVARRS